MSHSDADKWKQKCLNLAEELDEQQARRERHEKCMARALVRLSHICQGIDQSLDPYLQRLREILKSGRLDDQKLEYLDTFANTLLDLEFKHAPTVNWQVQVLELFYSQAQGEGERAVFSKFQEIVKKRPFEDAEALFHALEEALQASSAKPSPSLFSRWFRRIPETASTDEGVLKEQLLQLIQEIEIPPRLTEQSENLLNQLKQAHCDIEEVLEGTARLLSEIKAQLKKEQQEIEDFLSTLTNKLQNLEQQALDVGKVFSSEEVWGDSVSRHVEHLRHHALEETDLEALKTTISSRLDMLTQQLRHYQEAEAQRNSEVDQKVRAMTERLQALERESQELHQRLRLAHQQALYDPVTGLPNRKAVEERLAQEFSRWQRFKQPVSLLVWDIDRFKQINDRFGHQAGDKALRIVAQTLGQGIREADFIGRYGGEEFVMLLPGTEVEGGLKVAEKLRRAVETCGFNSRGKPVPITISCGITEFREGDRVETAFERADKALYEAKQAGRNCCRAN
ncbi:MAG: hypothetical protein AXA67_00745 [Methylothermaceae bacteria B42]|nr:MAG: hypothetical protein AXA67_00745 [Methylothermaceae bacteria B42]HHJ39694.1 diguanylate cyclase [Methylothermaceae bacterium]